MAEKKKAGRPTTDVIAERNWHEIPNKMKARVPVLVEKAMQRMEDILTNKDSADSNVLRAAEGVIKLYKEMKEAEVSTLAQDIEDAENASGVAAAIAATTSPLISLVAYDPSKKTG